MRKCKAIVFGLTGFILLLAFFVPLISLIFTLIKNALPALHLSLITELTPPPGTPGGLKNALAGSVEMVGVALLFAIPSGVLLGAALMLYKHKKWVSLVRLVNDCLLSFPSILYGLMVYLVIVIPMGHFSGFAGSVALSLIAAPIIARGTEDLLCTLPPALKEAGFALGASEGRVIFLLLKSTVSGMVGIIMLAFARIFGETAPLLFTSLNSPFMPDSFFQPTASLPVTLYNFAMSPDAEWQAISSAGALLMIILVLGLSFIARYLIDRRLEQ